MADAPSPLPTRGVLDLSTGPAAPPPPPPAPRPPATPDPDVKVGKVLDLSKRPAVPGPPPPRDVFGSGPVIRETIDLSTKAASLPEAAEKPAEDQGGKSRRQSGAGRSGPPNRPGPQSQGSQNRSRSKNRPEPSERSEPSGRPKPQKGVAPKSASSSLADLLDPDVLARLRGDG